MAAMLFLLPSLAHADIKFGVATNRGELKTREDWSAMTTMLTQELGTPVQLVPVVIEKSVQAFANKEVDYIVSNPVIAAIVNDKHEGKIVAMMDLGQGPEFAGVIFAGKNAGIKTIEDMKGKKVMSYTKDSAGAYTFQMYELKKRGLNSKDFASFVIAKKQDDIPMAVKAGLFDAGFVRDGILESMAKKGLLSLDDFVIVNKQSDSLSTVHSTPLYPEWQVVAQGGADAVLLEKLAKTLIGLKADNPAMQKAGVKSFLAPKSLDALIAVLKELKAAPYDK